jgi:hypothetical protein
VPACRSATHLDRVRDIIYNIIYYLYYNTLYNLCVIYNTVRDMQYCRRCAISDPAFEDPELRLPGLWQQQPQPTAATCRASTGGAGAADAADAANDDLGRYCTSPDGPLRMPSLLQRLRVIVIQLLQYDGPLESRAELCEQERHLVHALDRYIVASEQIPDGS